MTKPARHVLTAAILGTLILAAARPGVAAEEPVPESALQEIIVQGVRYRELTETAAPVLQYDLPYFQKFEPLTVGDMLKRTPSATFLSDVLEYDGVRLRGLDSAYTQVLINGEKVPGAGIDRSFFVDRIPAELVERIEIIRSTSADRGSEGVAGSLNVVLKDDASFEGGFVRGGGLHFDDGETKGTFGAAYAGSLGAGRFWIGANTQGRRNPKEKVTRFKDGAGELVPQRELESDVRDGTDSSVSGALELPLGGGSLELQGFYVQTDRDEREDVQLLEGDDLSSLEVTELEGQDEDIEQRNYSGSAVFSMPLLGGTTRLRGAWAQFRDEVEAIAYEADAGETLVPVERETTDTRDQEIRLGLSQAWDLSDVRLTAGIDWLQKQRDADNRLFEIEDDEESDATPPSGLYGIEEERIDPYVKLAYETGGAVRWETGVRFENTQTDVTTADGLVSDSEYSFVSPSAHVVVKVTDLDRISFSLARTSRRPDFDRLAPAPVNETPADEDIFTGNPDLEPELAWGADLGYERRLGSSGVVGLNAFYRNVEDVVELVSTGRLTPDGGLYYTAGNVGNGKAWGLELDLSSPLTVIGLEHTGVFLNYSWLDSEIVDPVLGNERRFNNQPDFVLNGGFIQDIPPWGASFGVTYRQQGDALGIVLGESRETRYEGDLEVFLEKRFGANFVARITANNLLDGAKEEDIFEYDGDSATALAAAQRAHQIDGIELESEQAGPVLQLILRAAF